MAEHSDLAKGILTNTSQGKVTANRLWDTLATKLNASGPPTKDSKMWRKVYSDQKQMVKKKLSFNKSSKRRTGGGPYEEKLLSHCEEQLVEAAGINVSVEGLKEVETFGSVAQGNISEYQSSDLEATIAVILNSDDDSDDIEEMEGADKEPQLKKCKYVQKKVTKSKREPRETKTDLLKKNIASNQEYHTEHLNKLEKLIQIKTKTLEMEQQEHALNMEIKRIELQIRTKKLEKLQD